MKAILVAGIVLAIIISFQFVVIRSQKGKIDSLSRDLKSTQTALSVLEEQTKHLSLTFKAFDSAFNTYMDNQKKAHDNYRKALQALDTKDPDVADWLDYDLPQCVQDAISGDNNKGTESPVLHDGTM